MCHNIFETLRDTALGVNYGIWQSRHHLVHSFVIIPAGILLLLSILYGLNVVLADVAHVRFPSSVLCMLINLLVLVSLSGISSLQAKSQLQEGTWKDTVGRSASWALEHYLMVVRPPMNFSLKWINVFFIPSFVVLPLSDSISIIECLKIGAVFVIGGVTLLSLNIYTILCLRKVLKVIRSHVSSNLQDPVLGKENCEAPENTKYPIETNLLDLGQSYIVASRDITTIDLRSLRPSKTESKIDEVQAPNHAASRHGRESDCTALKTVVTAPVILQSSAACCSFDTHLKSEEAGSQGKPKTLDASSQISPSAEIEVSTTVKSVAIFTTNYIDWMLYLALFVIALPFYYVSAIHVMLPFHLGLTILSYFFALHLLDAFPVAKRFAHPILISTAEILFVCFITSLSYHHGSPKGFLDDLRYYKTGKNYLNLFNGREMYNNGDSIPPEKLDFTSQPLWPGCGDFLSSLMDVSIISLSLPMFTHRKDFLRNFWIIVPSLLSSVGSTFFCYPIICFKIGISPERSIGFIGRSVTLALGTPLIDSLGGSVSLMAVCTILSGICGVLVGDSIFKALRIPPNDYLTRGVTLGINCGAIATAHLLTSDPRAASMSSLSFSLFGTSMIILASVGVVRDLIRGWVGL